MFSMMMLALSIAAALPGLDRDREIALARTAGLRPWSENATIYVLGPTGYEKAVEGSNGFTCLVGRSGPGTSWPICFDAVGTESILPRYVREAALRLAGKTEDEVRADTARRFLEGEYRPPSRTGIAYMLSKDAITSNGKDLIVAPPHLMIYAPNVRRDELGVVNEHPHSPVVLFEGDPHGYIIVFVADEPVPLKVLGPVPRTGN
jgi:hypothetical protein